MPELRERERVKRNSKRTQAQESKSKSSKTRGGNEKGKIEDV